MRVPSLCLVYRFDPFLISIPGPVADLHSSMIGPQGCSGPGLQDRSPFYAYHQPLSQLRAVV